MGRNVRALAQFPLNTRDESNKSGRPLFREGSVSLIRDFPEFFYDRRRAVIGKRCRPSLRGPALQLGHVCPYAHSFASLCRSKRNEPKRPTNEARNCKGAELLARGVFADPPKRAFSAGVLFATYTNYVFRMRNGPVILKWRRFGSRYALEIVNERPRGAPWPLARAPDGETATANRIPLLYTPATPEKGRTSPRHRSTLIARPPTDLHR